MATGSNIRVGDAERDAVATQLREHYGDGRLTLDELNERLDQTLRARTAADLTAVTQRPAVSGQLLGWRDGGHGPAHGPGQPGPAARPVAVGEPVGRPR